MRRASHIKTAGLVAAALFVGLAVPFQPLAAGPEPDAPKAIEDALRALQSRQSDTFRFSKEPREVRIANCLRNARNTADAMALECERRHPRNKMGNAPGLDDCYDGVVDFLRIEQASCRKIR